MQRSTRRHGGRRRLACAIATAAVLLAPGVARADCADDIIDEVINTGQITGDYPLRCYDQALQRLNPDLEEYGEAPSIIRTAKVAQRDRDRQQAAVTTPAGGGDGGGEGSGDAGGDGGGGADPGADPGAGDAGGEDVPVDDGGLDEGEDGGTLDREAAEAEPEWEIATDTVAAADAFDDDDGGRPVGPLVLGALAVGLIAVGGGGMIYRRVTGR